MKKTPAKQRHLDDSERNEIAYKYAAGITPTRIALEIGRDKGTVINAVRNDEQLKTLIDGYREELGEMFEQTARRALGALTDAKLDGASARDLIIVAGTSYDKMRLHRGQSTENIAVIMASAVVEATKQRGDKELTCQRSEQNDTEN